MGRYWSMITIWDVVDILIMSIVVYKLIQLMRRSNAMRILRGILMILLAMLLAQIMQLRLVTVVLTNTVQIGLFALVVLFQPELRKILEQMGATSFRGALGAKSAGNSEENIVLQTVSACGALSWQREGALIVYEQSVMLDDILATGTSIDAEVSAELLKAIFNPKAPLHDGAVIIRDGRIAGAGCMLPMTGQLEIGAGLGMRHRAGIGMSENADALVVIVSEETGAISVAKQGELTRDLTVETLDEILRRELVKNNNDNPRGIFRVLGRSRRKRT